MSRQNAQPWYQIRNSAAGADGPAEILIYDEIDSWFGVSAEALARDIAALDDSRELRVRINSPGGNVFDGVAILASNLRDNIDAAFARRFESVIFFPLPRPEERLRLWQRGFSRQAALEPALDLEEIARQHALAGGSIMNVIRFASLQALRRGTNLILASDVLAGIRREQSKEGTGA